MSNPSATMPAMTVQTGRNPWVASVLIVLTVAVCTLNSFQSVVKGHSGRYVPLLACNAVFCAVIILAFARGTGLLIAGARAFRRARLHGALLVIPLLVYSVHLLLVQNWFAKQLFIWVMMLDASLPPEPSA